MSILNTFLRAVETMSTVELDGRSKGGMMGEQYADYFIANGQNESYIRNPIIPHPRKKNIYFETDAVVYIYGTIFCVEIKNYKGRVYYPPLYRTEQVQKGWFIFKRTVTRQVQVGFDDSRIIQEKVRYGGNGVDLREMPNPLKKTQNYANDLRRFLSRLDARMENVPIISVVAFTERTDIRAIYNPQTGIISIPELPNFFAAHKSPNSGSMPWIQQTLRRLATWDHILTTDNEDINGIIEDTTFTFKDTDGHIQNIPYAQIHSIEFQRAGLLSPYDDMIIYYTDGKKRTFRSTSGEIHLERFGQRQTHKLRNITRVVVGIANKR